MNKLIRYLLVSISLAGGCVNLAAAAGSGDQGPVFVAPESLPEAFKSTTLAVIDGFNRRDVVGLAKYFDFEKLGIETCKGLYDTDEDHRICVSSVTNSRHRVLSSMVDLLATSNGKLTLTGYVRRTRGVMSQVRFDLGEYGLDYLEFLLSEKSDGSYQVADWYRLTSGQMFSETIGVISRLLIDPDPGILKKLFGITGLATDNLEIIKSMGVARSRGDYAEANRLYSALSPEIRNTRVFLEIGIQFANLLNDDALYRKRLKSLAETHSEDASAAFMLLDHYYYEGNVDKALANIEVIEQKIGRDGYTALLKGNVYFDMAGEYDKARALYRQAIEIEPGLYEPYDALAYTYIVEENFAKAVEVYKLLEVNLGYRYTADDFYDSPEVSRFKASAEFRQWMASR